MYVVGFVPCSDLPKDLPEYLDPFLKPLMDDLCNGFLSGYNIPYPLQFTSDEFHSSETEIIRLLLLCWTGYHPGQCEVGKFLSQGKCGCRREKLHGQQLQLQTTTTTIMGTTDIMVATRGKNCKLRRSWKTYMTLKMRQEQV